MPTRRPVPRASDAHRLPLAGRGSSSRSSRWSISRSGLNSPRRSLSPHKETSPSVQWKARHNDHQVASGPTRQAADLAHIIVYPPGPWWSGPRLTSPWPLIEVNTSASATRASSPAHAAGLRGKTAIRSNRPPQFFRSTTGQRTVADVGRSVCRNQTAQPAYASFRLACLRRRRPALHAPTSLRAENRSAAPRFADLNRAPLSYISNLIVILHRNNTSSVLSQKEQNTAFPDKPMRRRRKPRIPSTRSYQEPNTGTTLGTSLSAKDGQQARQHRVARTIGLASAPDQVSRSKQSSASVSEDVMLELLPRIGWPRNGSTSCTLNKLGMNTQ
jgi:hypothetical protein